MKRYSRITINGKCLEPIIKNQQVVDGLVDFEFEDIEVNDFVLYIYGGTQKRIKKVLALSGDYFDINEKEIITNNKRQGLTESSARRLNGYHNRIPHDCVLTVSCERKCDHARIVHSDSITRLVKRPRSGFIINSS
jgi:hypothetical protein